jgi:hypothetical protein
MLFAVSAPAAVAVGDERGDVPDESFRRRYRELRDDCPIRAAPPVGGSFADQADPLTQVSVTGCSRLPI